MKVFLSTCRLNERGFLQNQFELQITACEVRVYFFLHVYQHNLNEHLVNIHWLFVENSLNIHCTFIEHSNESLNAETENGTEDHRGNQSGHLMLTGKSDIGSVVSDPPWIPVIVVIVAVWWWIIVVITKGRSRRLAAGLTVTPTAVVTASRITSHDGALVLGTTKPGSRLWKYGIMRNKVPSEIINAVNHSSYTVELHKWNHD